MGFNKISNVSLTDLFVEQIENLILSGELSIGERLPSSRDLTSKMGVSRQVVTAGLIKLEQLGFVKIKAREGVYVTDYREQGTIETLLAIMRYHGGTMREDEVRSLLEVRGSLEQLSCKLAIANLTESKYQKLRTALEKIHEAHDSKEAAEAIFNFHHQIAVMSNNVLLPLMYYSFKEEAEYLWGLSYKHLGIDSLYQEKSRLLEGIRKRDTDSVERQVKETIDSSIRDLKLYSN
ncbi:MAG: GntR family transcriptional regulator [Bacilli bacterium]|jgi:DNA-binding FadR family transcriptional regulator|nr:GntR family transcriptional regulator [Bacilli bacterium]